MVVNDFPIEVNKVEESINKKLLKDFTGERTGFIQVGPQKYFFPCKFLKEARYLYNFKVRSDDTWVVTFPRSGSQFNQWLHLSVIKSYLFYLNFNARFISNLVANIIKILETTAIILIFF